LDGRRCVAISTETGKELTFPGIFICPKWIPHEFDLVAMLANSGLCHPVPALSKLCRKKKSSKRSCSDSSAQWTALRQTGQCWFAFRECGWCNLLLDDIAEKNSQTLAPNISATAHSYGMAI
jgi:hypothetical protein